MKSPAPVKANAKADANVNAPAPANIREASQALIGILYPDSADLRMAAEKLGIPFETARQARDYGKGSVTTINGLILQGLGVTQADLPRYLAKVRKMLAPAAELNVLDNLIEEALRRYGSQGLIAWLRLLLARFEIEKELNIKNQTNHAPNPKKKPKKD